MPLSKEDAMRALSILESLFTELEKREREEDGDEETLEALLALEATLDRMQSPLFSALVDIGSKYHKDVQESQTWNATAEVRVSEEPELAAQFRQHYGVSSVQQNGLPPASLKAPAQQSNEDFMEELLTGVNSEPSSSEAKFEQDSKSPSMHHAKLPSSEASSDSHVSTDVSAAGGRRWRRRGREGGVTLAGYGVTHTGERVSTDSRQQVSKEVKEVGKKGKQTKANRGEDEKEVEREEEEGEEEEKEEEEDEDSSQPRDILYFMRHRPSLEKIQETLHGRFGRSVHKINLPHPSVVHSPHSASACEKLGIELSGSSASGVFVAGVVRSREAGGGGRGGGGGELQVGDQVLEVNGKPTDNLASFEVEHLIESVDESQQIVLHVVYNPTGLIEQERVRKC